MGAESDVSGGCAFCESLRCNGFRGRFSIKEYIKRTKKKKTREAGCGYVDNLWITRYFGGDVYACFICLLYLLVSCLTIDYSLLYFVSACRLLYKKAVDILNLMQYNSIT